ncbi:MAG: MerR family transcriptional regulator [Desulfovibrio sp.]|nr:MerR family transcriptional regulator [Desulfovibrio sp.]
MIRQEEFLLATGLSQETFQDVLSLGWVEMEKDDEDQLLFSDTDVYRVRKMIRICSDFDLPLIGGVIIVDLLERIDRLEETIAALEAKQEVI